MHKRRVLIIVGTGFIAAYAVIAAADYGLISHNAGKFFALLAAITMPFAIMVAESVKRLTDFNRGVPLEDEHSQLMEGKAALWTLRCALFGWALLFVFFNALENPRAVVMAGVLVQALAFAAMRWWLTASDDGGEGNAE